jgi:hypothetical protein
MKTWTKFERKLFSDPEYREKIGKKFKSLVYKTTSDDCWEWIGSHAENGYGVMNLYPLKVMGLAHRIAWIFHHWKPINPRHQICHTCDYRCCCNPNHLVAKTRLWNMRDCVAKGRFKYATPLPGSASPNSTLTEKDAQFIRENFDRGAKHGCNTRSALAKKFRVSGMTIYRIANKIGWKHITKEASPKRNSLTERQKAEIRKRYTPRLHSGSGSRRNMAKHYAVPAWAIDGVTRSIH